MCYSIAPFSYLLIRSPKIVHNHLFYILLMVILKITTLLLAVTIYEWTVFQIIIKITVN